MHAATSHVGNIVQIQTPAGHIYEGVFRTFSSQFQIVLEMAYRVEIGPDQKPKIIVESFVDRLIFKPNDIVTLAAKDVDPEDATRDTFKTDTAISRCNGTNWLEDRVLEPWDESGDVNGESLEHSLELDSNAEGWDVNDMFLKNEQVYGVQSTFDQSLSGYTVQIQKKDSEEFKVQEQEAEKIANEIENNPVYKERIDIENGDEEAAFAAVVRPNSNVSPQPAATTQQGANDKNSNSVSSNSSGGGGGGGGAGGNMNVNSNQKSLPQRPVRQYANAPTQVTYSEPPPSLAPQQMPGQMQPMSTKPPMHLAHPHHTVVPSHMPPPNVEHVVIQQHPMVMPPPGQQQPPPQQQQQQVQAPPPQPQRTVLVRNRDMEIDNLRKFGQDFNLASPQQQPPMPNVHQQPPPPAPQSQQQPQQGPPSHNAQPPPPQQQQQPDHTSPPSLDSSPPLVNSQKQGKMVVSAPHSEPPPQSAPLNQQQNQASQTASGMVVVPTQMSSQSPHLVQQPPPVVQQQAPPPGQQQPVVVGGSPPLQQPPQTNHVPAGGVPTATGPVSQNSVTGSGVTAGNAAPNANGTPDGTSANGSAGGEQKPGTATKKVFTLNPAAKPFTPRSPSTPNPSRHTSSSPHTPQTPGPAALTQGSFQPPSPHVIPQQFVMSYVVNSSPFQTAQQHQQVAQQTRIRNGRQGSYRNDIFPVGASQMQVAAATGQPLLAPSPLQMITTPYGPTIHAQPFQAAPPFHQQYRLYEQPQGPLQYLAATPPSTTPSPGQPHQQYHPGPQPSPAGGGPPTYQAVHHQQPTPYPIPVCPIVPQQVVPAIYQNIPSAPQQNHHQQNLHVMHVAQHPSAQ
uniref:LsmAD domain-containing protein n=1 Tax=Anopheles minimus TaxID=112268 RepID=A0A182VY05_9DIPT